MLKSRCPVYIECCTRYEDLFEDGEHFEFLLTDEDIEQMENHLWHTNKCPICNKPISERGLKVKQFIDFHIYKL